MIALHLCKIPILLLLLLGGVGGCKELLGLDDLSFEPKAGYSDSGNPAATPTDTPADTLSSDLETANDSTESKTDDSGTLPGDTEDSSTVEVSTTDSETATETPADNFQDSVSSPPDTVDTETIDSSAGDSDAIDTDTGLAMDVTVVLNPYSAVDWETWGQYKANFHTHTTNSDGDDSPKEVIKQYHSKAYDILAITDHNYFTWPWTDYGMDPAVLGMLAIKGDEYSTSHHVNVFYNFTKTATDMATGIPHAHEQGGLSQINHPGRYAYSNETYLNYFEQYSSCVWLEVFNQGDRYPGDRERWDQINEQLFYEQGKFVWGASNDDKHRASDLYRNFEFMLAPELTENAIRTAQTTGAFYFAYEPEGSGEAKVPRILSVEINNAAKTITVKATAYDAIYWIGPGSEVVAHGSVFHFADYAKQARIRFILDVLAGFAKRPFVRFVLEGPNGDTYSQPFGFEATPMDTHIAQ